MSVHYTKLADWLNRHKKDRHCRTQFLEILGTGTLGRNHRATRFLAWFRFPTKVSEFPKIEVNRFELLN